MSGQAYVGSSKRTFEVALGNMLAKDYSLVGSERVRQMIVEDVLALVEQFYPPTERMRPGWVVFTGTKASGKKAYPGQEGGDHELVTIPWPLLLPEDVTTHIEAPSGELGKKELHNLLLRRLVRLVEHGLHHEQGPVLLTQADLSLLMGLKTEQISQLLAQARQETGKALITKGYYFDQGMRPTHKAQIIALYEGGVDEAVIAQRTQHSPQSVGRYIRDYERVKLLVERQIALEEMAPLTGMTPGVVKAHWKLLQQHRPDLFAENGRNIPFST
jgi:hypothetical protein